MVVTVEAPVGNIVGKVKQECSMLPPKFSVLNANDEVVLEIHGPACMLCPAFCEVNFEVNGKHVCFYITILFVEMFYPVI